MFVRKVLCIMVAASHCNCFSQCVKRGRGSAAGAAEDHMTCMLDALQTMGQNMIAAKSTTWNYLKRAGDNDLTLKRASRSLAKTGSQGQSSPNIACTKGGWRIFKRPREARRSVFTDVGCEKLL